MIFVEREKYLDAKAQGQLMDMLNRHFSEVVSFVSGIYKECGELEERNIQEKMDRGDIEEEKVRQVAKSREHFERVVSNLQVLSDIIHREMPVFEDNRRSLPSIDLPPDEFFEQLYENEKQQSFYENIPEVVEDRLQDPNVNFSDELYKVLERLYKNHKTSELQGIAQDFIKIATKNNRRILIERLVVFPQALMQMLPDIAKFIAIISPIYKDIAPSLIPKLEQEFKQISPGSNSRLADEKVKYVKFLCELRKFRLCPSEIIFSCMNNCMNDFSGFNIEVVCHLINSVGRFLQRDRETYERFTIMLDRLLRLKKKKNLPHELDTLVEDTYYMFNAGDKKKKNVEKPLIHQYIKYLFLQLSPATCEKTISAILTLPIPESEPYLCQILIKTLTRCKFTQLPSFGNMLSAIIGHQEFHNFLSQFIDLVCEEILQGLRENNFKLYQIRIIMVRFFALMFNYRLINRELLFDMMYAILLYSPQSDHPKDGFRIRMICNILEICGAFLAGSERYRPHLERFFVDFQKYIATKRKISIDIELLVKDLLEDLSFYQRRGPEQRDSASEGSDVDIPVPEEAKFDEEFDIDRELEFAVQESLMEAREKAVERKEVGNIYRLTSPEKALPDCKFHLVKNFKILIKKGGKFQATSIQVPEDHLISQVARNREEMQLREREDLSQRVSNLSRMMDTEAKQKQSPPQTDNL